MVSFPTKLWWPTFLSFMMPIICLLDAVADDEDFQNWKMQYIKLNLTAMDAAPNVQCPKKGISSDSMGGFNIKMGLVDFEKLAVGNCLSFYFCYESISYGKTKPQYHEKYVNPVIKFVNMQGTKIGKMCEKANSEQAKFHGFSVKLCPNGNAINGTIEQSITNHAWNFKVPDANIEKTVNLILHFSINSMELNLWRGMENKIRQKGGFYHFNEGQLNKENSLWFTFIDAKLLQSKGDFYRHFYVFYPNVCEVSKENSKTDNEGLVIECPANQNNGTENNEFNQCGKRHHKREEPRLNPYISGGEQVMDMVDWPWLVALKIEMSLQSKKDNKWATYDFRCTGTIIGRQYVLTAAHCVTYIPGINGDEKKFIDGKLLSVTVYAGQEHYTVPNAQIRFASELYVNLTTLVVCVRFPEDDFKTLLGFDDDIAVIKLSQPFNFNERVSAVCLTSEERRENLQCNWATAIGWGHTKPDQDIVGLPEEWIKPEEFLHKTQVRILKFAKCRNERTNWIIDIFKRQHNVKPTILQIYQMQKLYVFPYDKLLCIRGERDSSPQQGDSGGPLLKYNEKNGLYEVVGVTSSVLFRNSIEDRPRPASYIDVTLFRDWIREVQNGLIPADVVLNGDEKRDNLAGNIKCN